MTDAASIDVRDAFRIHGSGAGAVAALRGLSLRVERGEVVVVLGPSGAGKTTLLRVLAGLEPLSAGTACVGGVDVTSLRRRAAAFRARRLGLVDQHYVRSLSPDLTCRETVALQLRLLGEERRSADRRALDLLERVGLRDRADARPAALSGGEQQRVAVCAAIVHRPQLLLADEPAGELDADNAATVYSLLGQLARADGAAALVVSHDRAATAIADRTVALHDGRIVEEERAAAPSALVVSGGWLRIPSALQRDLGEPTRVAAARDRRTLVLTPLDAAAEESAIRAAATNGARRGELVASIRSAEKRYGTRTVLAGLHLEVRAGTFTAIVGRSGSGKTTLLHLLAGLVRPDAGEVAVAATPLAALGRGELAVLRRRHVALVTQEPGLVPHLSAAENVELALQIRAGDPRGDVAAELARLGLASVARTRADRLSAGERQRTAIARALAARAGLLLVDEPTARLDSANARLVARLLVAAAHDRGVAVVCATHDEELVELADEVVRLPLAGTDRPPEYRQLRQRQPTEEAR